MLFEEGDYVYDRSTRRAGRVARVGGQEVEITCPQSRTHDRFVWSADNLLHEEATELSLDEQAAIVHCRFWHEHRAVMEMLAE